MGSVVTRSLEHYEYRLIRIRWDKDHQSPWAVFMGTTTDARKMATEIHKILGPKSVRGGYPMVEIAPYPVSILRLYEWAKSHQKQMQS